MTFSKFLPVILAASLIACGGGGSSSSSTTSISNTNSGEGGSSSTTATSNTYTGKRDLALLTTANSMDFVRLVFGSEHVSDTLAARPDNATESDTIQFQQAITASLLARGNNLRYQARASTETEACQEGGSVTVTENAGNTAQVSTFHAVYHQCKDNYLLLNGNASVTMRSQSSGEFTDASFMTENLEVTSGGIPYRMTGSLQLTKNLTTLTTTSSIANFYRQNLSNGKQSLLENVKTTLDSSDFYQISGRFCDGMLGCVTVATVHSFDSVGYGIGQGEMLMSGAVGSKLQVRAARKYDPPSYPYWHNLQLNLDADGNGNYEAQSIRNADALLKLEESNLPPIANVGKTPVVTSQGKNTVLDGSNSTDPNGDFLSYQWYLESFPAGSNAKIQQSAARIANLRPDLPGSYVISLKVTDEKGAVHAITHTLNTLAIRPLAHSVKDAEYSKSLDKIIAVDSQLGLFILDPTTGVEQTIYLPKAPTAVAVSPDGHQAAVGHDGLVSIVDLKAGLTIAYYPVAFRVFDVVFATNGYLYFTDDVVQSGFCHLYSFNIAKGTVAPIASNDVGLLERHHIKQQPGSSFIYAPQYWDAASGIHGFSVAKFAIDAGNAEKLYDSYFNINQLIGNDLWFTQDGLFFLSESGKLFQTSSTQGGDFLYQANITGLSGIDSPFTNILGADHSTAKNQFVTAIHSLDFTGELTVDRYVLNTYTTPLMMLDSSVNLTDISGDGSNDQVIPQFVFFNSNGTKRYAVLQQGNGTYLMGF